MTEDFGNDSTSSAELTDLASELKKVAEGADSISQIASASSAKSTAEASLAHREEFLAEEHTIDIAHEIKKATNRGEFSTYFHLRADSTDLANALASLLRDKGYEVKVHEGPLYTTPFLGISWEKA